MSQSTDRRGLVAGAGAGVAAFAVGYAITYAWQAGNVERTLAPINALAGLFGGDPIPIWKVVGWLYLAAHAVPVAVRVGPLGPRSIDLIAAGDGSLELLYLLPPVLVAVAGFLVARRWSGDGRPADAALAGATVVLGYGPAAVLAALAVRIGESGPILPRAVLLAGVVLPVVFGALGGAVHHGVRTGGRRP